MKFIPSLLLLLLATASVFSQDKKPVLLPIDSPAPDFDLPGADGKNYSLDDFKEHELLAVIFTCNHCPTAQAYEDRIIQMVEDYRGRGVGFVAISPNDASAISLAELGYSDLNDTLEEMKIRVKDKNYNFPYLYDGDSQETSIAYGPAATPHVFLFDKERKLRYEGRIDNMETMKEEVDAWQKHRNNKTAKIDWQFQTKDARIKLKRLYPKLNDWHDTMTVIRRQVSQLNCTKLSDRRHIDIKN